jgi:hypothetical protein
MPRERIQRQRLQVWKFLERATIVFAKILFPQPIILRVLAVWKYSLRRFTTPARRANRDLAICQRTSQYLQRVIAGQIGCDINAPAQASTVIGGCVSQDDQLVSGDGNQRALPYFYRF